MSIVQIPDVAGTPMTMVDVGGFIQPNFMLTGPETKEIFENVPKYRFRDDDVMLLTYPKTGTNWMYEIISMILNKSSEYVKTMKTATMMEARKMADIDAELSPRIMNVHYPFRYLPVEGLKEKQIKTVACLRNPKDTAVSYYNHMNGIKTYNYFGKWNDWLPVYLQGKLEYGKYTDYLKELETAIKEGVEFPLHVMYYEDLKMDGIAELDKLSKFLEIELDAELKKKIVEACGFENMKNKPIPESLGKKTEEFFHNDFQFMRKGTVGNWKSWFTVAQNEEFDRIWKAEMEGCDMFKFKYTM